MLGESALDALAGGRLLLELGAGAGYLGRHGLVHETIAVTGACLAVRGMFQRLGGSDASRFPVEGNDVGLCFKARMAGLKVLYAPNATLYDLESRIRTLDDADRRLSSETARGLWKRWGSSVCPDPHFNRHRSTRPSLYAAPGSPCMRRRLM